MCLFSFKNNESYSIVERDSDDDDDKNQGGTSGKGARKVDTCTCGTRPPNHIGVFPSPLHSPRSMSVRKVGNILFLRSKRNLELDLIIVK